MHNKKCGFILILNHFTKLFTFDEKEKMSDRLRKATINDIAVKELFCYDEENKKDLYDFCFRNSISYLPSLDRTKLYRLASSNFVEQPLDTALCFGPHELLFADSTLEQFRQVDSSEIRFVIENGLIIGVVHIVDYNNEFVAVELYRALFKYENNLRHLLMKSGFGNKDFINWAFNQWSDEKYNDNTGKTYWQDKCEKLLPADANKRSKIEGERNSASPFQTFFFSDLLKFSIDKKILPTQETDYRNLNQLRNYVAHTRHLTSYTENEEGQFIYDFQNLKKFVYKINEFLDSYKFLENLISQK